MTKTEKFEYMGGRNVLIKINKVFYDKVYAYPWLKLYFQEIPQQNIEDQQVDFMQKVLGGTDIYIGKTPAISHNHMFIPNELFDVRKKLLQESFQEVGAHSELVDKWLSLDELFRRLIVNKSPRECQPRFKTDPNLNFPKP